MPSLMNPITALMDRIYLRKMEIVELHGIKIPLDSSVISPTVEKHIRNGQYEAREASKLQEIIVEGERVLELGAGIGFLACLILKNPRTEAYLGVEAHPELPKFIQKVFRINHVAGRILNAAVTSEINQDCIDFYVRKDFWISSDMPGIEGANQADTDKPIKVKCRTLNQLIKQFRPSLIICDIEGGELGLFDQADLQDVSKVYLELHEDVIGVAGIARVHETLAKQEFYPVGSKSADNEVMLFSRS